MATEAGSALFSPSVLQLLQNAIGGTKDQTIVKDETSTTTGSQATTGTQAGSSSQATTGTNTASGSTSTTGATTGQQSSSTQKTADVSKLEQIFAQQQAGISPELLNAIFTQGAGQVPGLVSTLANAVGARRSSNTPLAAGLGTLMAQLTGKAAELTAAQRNASGQTAAAIADATGGQTTTGTTQQQSTQQQATQQLTELLQNVMGNTTQNSTQNSTNTSNVATSGTTSNSEDTKLDSGNVSKMLGSLLGMNLLGSGLQGAGIDGLGGLLGMAQGGATQAGSGLAGALKPLLALLGGNGGAGGQLDLSGILPGLSDSLGNGSLNLGDIFGSGNLGNVATGSLPGFDLSGFDLGSLLGSSPLDLSGALDQGLANLSTNTLAPDWWSNEGWDTYFDADTFGEP